MGQEIKLFYKLIFLSDKTKSIKIRKPVSSLAGRRDGEETTVKILS
jgi:hypothetical protein